jgi:hypothetical protein
VTESLTHLQEEAGVSAREEEDPCCDCVKALIAGDEHEKLLRVGPVADGAEGDGADKDRHNHLARRRVQRAEALGREHGDGSRALDRRCSRGAGALPCLCLLAGRRCARSCLGLRVQLDHSVEGRLGKKKANA